MGAVGKIIAEVILEITPDSGAVAHHGNAVAAQDLRRPYSRHKQKMRRADRACTEDDFPSRARFVRQ